MSKIKLRREKLPASFRDNTIQWSQSLPFVTNRRCYLIHRVRSVSTHMRNGVRSHETVHCWCDNTKHIPEFLDAPPTDRLLCAMCEAKAVKAGEPSAEQLTGRHVCIGEMRPVRRCCFGTQN